jgi:hypothetical protein
VISPEFQFEEDFAAAKLGEHSARQLANPVPIQIKFAQIPQLLKAAHLFLLAKLFLNIFTMANLCANLAKRIVGKVQFHEGIQQDSIECPLLQMGKGIPVEDKPEDCPIIEGIGRKGGNCLQNEGDALLGPIHFSYSVNNGQGINWETFCRLGGLQGILQTAGPFTNDGNWLINGGGTTARGLELRALAKNKRKVKGEEEEEMKQG